MKKIIFFVFILCSCFVYSQSKQITFKKYYKIPDAIGLIKLKVKKKVKFDSLNDIQKRKIKRKHKIGEKFPISYTETVDSKVITLNRLLTIDNSFYKKQSFDSIMDAPVLNNRKGYIKFDEETGKIFVNPWLVKNKETGDFKNREDIYYYKLKNRQSVNIWFSEFSISALTVPIKYRFKDREQNLSEDFTTGFNVNLFFGKAWGRTKFLHRKKVGLKTFTEKFTFGALIGASTVELNINNTSLDATPLPKESKINKGLFSFGFGGVYTYDKINFGLFYGWDYAIGDDSEKWNYNKEPWLGFGIGYEIF